MIEIKLFNIEVTNKNIIVNNQNYICNIEVSAVKNITNDEKLKLEH